MNTLKHPNALTPPVSTETGPAKDAIRIPRLGYDVLTPLDITFTEGPESAEPVWNILSRTICKNACASPMASGLPCAMASHDLRAPRRAFTSLVQRAYRAHIAAHGMGDAAATHSVQANTRLRAGHGGHPPSTAPWLSASAPIWVTHRRLALAP